MKQDPTANPDVPPSVSSEPLPCRPSFEFLFSALIDTQPATEEPTFHPAPAQTNVTLPVQSNQTS